MDTWARRVESVEGGTTSFYAYLGTETLAEKTGTSWTHYIYAGSLRIARVANGPSYYYHADHLGGIRLVTSMGASVLFSNGYQPFGQDNGTPLGSEGYKFTGKQSSTSNGFYYHVQRWYDTSTGRFISEDPAPGTLSTHRSLNPYTYVLNSPTILVDPSGQNYEFNHACPEYGGNLHPTFDTADMLAVLVVGGDLYHRGPPVPAVGGRLLGDAPEPSVNRIRSPDTGEPPTTAKEVGGRGGAGPVNIGQIRVNAFVKVLQKSGLVADVDFFVDKGIKLDSTGLTRAKAVSV